MFERYTDDARKVIFFARYEASRLGSPALEVEHLWLGLLRQNKRLMKRLAPDVTVERMHERIVRRGLPAERVSMAADMPLSGATRRALAAAAADAERLRKVYITSESLVAALLDEEQPSVTS